ncbi:glutamine synthetase [Pseudomonas aeruginosa]|nr:glutamine synthetase [Pseudomonas aeruginosa]
MLASLLDSLLLFCPNANSYRRFQANSYAPLAQTWASTTAP